MKIEKSEISIQEIVKYDKDTKECKGFIDKGEEGVYGLDGSLNIRPIYQREYRYEDKPRNAVINSIINNFPLNILYWIKNKDGKYEVLDGQQRLVSIGHYVSNEFAVELPDIGVRYFQSLTPQKQDQILNYKLDVYFCEGTDEERIQWFQIINTGALKLTNQEIRNSIYSGPWVTDARRYFSKTNCVAYRLANDYLLGTPIKQEYLETVINWISGRNIEDYMSKHKNDENAEELWRYFQEVIEWTKSTFTVYRKEMKGVQWGFLYNDYKNNIYNPVKIENDVSRLMMDEDVSDKKGIYEYVLTNRTKKDEKLLNIRSFTDKDKTEAYENQKGICSHCKEHFDISDMEADHITPWSKGGKTVTENCQLLCLHCNRTKSAK